MWRSLNPSIEYIITASCHALTIKSSKRCRKVGLDITRHCMMIKYHQGRCACILIWMYVQSLYCVARQSKISSAFDWSTISLAMFWMWVLYFQVLVWNIMKMKVALSNQERKHFSTQCLWSAKLRSDIHMAGSLNNNRCFWSLHNYIQVGYAGVPGCNRKKKRRPEKQHNLIDWVLTVQVLIDKLSYCHVLLTLLCCYLFAAWSDSITSIFVAE